MRELASTLKPWTDCSKHFTPRRMTVWEWDYPSVAPLSSVIMAVCGQHRMMVREPRSRSLSLAHPGGNRRRTTVAAHESLHELRDLIRSPIDREMTRLEDVDFGLWHVAAISLRFRQLERQVVFAPEDEQPWLRLAHPGLPLRVGVDVGAVVVEEVALNVGLAWSLEKREFIGPEIGVVAFHVGIVADVARPRGCERQQVGAERGLVSGAIGPEGPSRLPIRPQAFVVGHRVLDDEGLDPVRMG